MRKSKSKYPDNWPEIAQKVKDKAGWKCVRCGHPHDPEIGYCLTVHHLDLNPANCEWWNIPALCQKCHLRIQAKVIMEQMWMFDHTKWFKPYAAGFYASINGHPTDTEWVMEHLEFLLEYGKPTRLIEPTARAAAHKQRFAEKRGRRMKIKNTGHRRMSIWILSLSLTMLLAHLGGCGKADSGKDVELEKQKTERQRLLAQLKDPDPEVRVEATKKIGALNDPSMAPYLVQALIDPHFRVPPASHYSLVSMASNAVPALLEGLRSNHPGLWQGSSLALQKIGEPAVQPLIQIWRSADFATRTHIECELGDIVDYIDKLT